MGDNIVPSVPSVKPVLQESRNMHCVAASAPLIDGWNVAALNVTTDFWFGLVFFDLCICWGFVFFFISAEQYIRYICTWPTI